MARTKVPEDSKQRAPSKGWLGRPAGWRPAAMMTELGKLKYAEQQAKELCQDRGDKLSQIHDALVRQLEVQKYISSLTSNNSNNINKSNKSKSNKSKSNNESREVIYISDDDDDNDDNDEPEEKIVKKVKKEWTEEEVTGYLKKIARVLEDLDTETTKILKNYANL